MRRSNTLYFGNPALTRHHCPKCGDEAIFKGGTCVRTGCGYALKQYKNLKIWESDIERSKRYRVEHAADMRARRAETHRKIMDARKPMKQLIDAQCAGKRR